MTLAARCAGNGVIPDPQAKAIIVDDTSGHLVIAAFYKATDIGNWPYCTECRELVVRWGTEWVHV